MAEKRIAQFPVFAADRTSVFLPRGAEILSCLPSRFGDGATQFELWVLQDLHAPSEMRELVIVGNQVPDVPLRFISTCVMPTGLVWHVFEVMRAVEREHGKAQSNA